MNIKKAEPRKDGLDMSVTIPVTMENNAYLESISNTEGLRFSDILEKMIAEHKKRGFSNAEEEVEQPITDQNDPITEQVEPIPENAEDCEPVEVDGAISAAARNRAQEQEREGASKKDKSKKNKGSK